MIYSELSERDKKSLKKLDIDAHTDVIWLECEEKSHQEHIQPLVRKRLLEDDKGGVLFSYSHFNILEFRIRNHSRDTKWSIYKLINHKSHGHSQVALSTWKKFRDEFFATCKIIWYLRANICLTLLLKHHKGLYLRHCTDPTRCWYVKLGLIRTSYTFLTQNIIFWEHIRYELSDLDTFWVVFLRTTLVQFDNWLH